MPIKFFFCYAREDEGLLNTLKNHLRPFERQGLIEFWHDRDICAGSEWEPEIKRRLKDADIVLLLVSPDFMASDYCYGNEMQQALERHVTGECLAIPIILRPVYWHRGPLGILQALPTDGKPITGLGWHDKDSAFYDVVAGIDRVLQEVAFRVMIKNLSLFRTLANQDYVERVALSGDGKTLVSRGSRIILATNQRVSRVICPDGSVKIWDVLTGRELRTLVDQAGIVSMALSGDGKIVVSGGGFNNRGGGSSIKIWDVLTGGELPTLAGHQEGVVSMALSGDGKTLVSEDTCGSIKIWDVLTGRELRTLVDQAGIVSMALSRDGKIVVSGGGFNNRGRYGSIKIWDVLTGRELRTLVGHQDIVWSVALSGDGKTLVSGSSDHTIKIWDVLTGRELRTLVGHQDGVESVALSGDGKILVSGSNDHTVKIWDVLTGRELRTLVGHQDGVKGVALSGDGKTLVSGSSDHTIKIWKV